MNRWMIYAHEGDGTHYWFDSHVPINVDEMRMVITMTHEQQIIQDAMDTPRQKVFIINKTRYRVVARGTRYEP